MNTPKLAIVIPLYKHTYFEDLLQALARQTNKNFNVYVGDDCSSRDPSTLINTYSKTMALCYHRFRERLGHISLTKQWERCVRLIQNEEWVWVLPDDDLPSDNVVEEFYRALATDCRENINVIRLPLYFIDKSGIVIRKPSESPLIEDNYAFYSRIVRGKAESSLGDNIFRRTALEASGGFVEFPKAWGSDHATVLNVSAGAYIYCLQNVSLGFRMSGENISSDTTDGHVKLAARVAFANWLKRNEHIFPTKPNDDFYKYFYWKGEYYAIHVFDFNIRIWRELFRLRNVCLRHESPLSFIKLLLLIFQAWTKNRTSQLKSSLRPRHGVRET